MAPNQPAAEMGRRYSAPIRDQIFLGVTENVSANKGPTRLDFADLRIYFGPLNNRLSFRILNIQIWVFQLVFDLVNEPTGFLFHGSTHGFLGGPFLE